MGGGTGTRVRGPLRPTARGLAVGTAAAVLVLAGPVLGRREALALGLFLAVLAAASLGVLAVHAGRVGRRRLGRTLVPEAVPAGGTVRVSLSGTAPGLHDALPGRDPVPVPSGSHDWPAARRGVYDLGPATAGLMGPFGLWSARVTVAGTGRVRVLPAPPDDAVLDGLLRAGLGGRHAADLLGRHAAPDDLLVREHRDGDPLTRIHWGATARTGRVMVRQEEWAPDPWTAVVLDCRAVSFPAGRRTVEGGAGRRWSTSGDFERAVSAAAAAADRLRSAGHRVLVLDQDGAPLEEDLAAAVLTPALREASWPASLPAGTAAVVAVLGAAVTRDLPVLASLPRSLRRAAVLVGVPDAGLAGPGSAGSGDGGPARALERAGWFMAEVPS
ncbi:DUF58 domain-containing protein [Citricoccus sp. SGAir0253]|uniref:DUF58 domain-containing protein n=1 Tax=Citricoccus sp. SGAir0253 TaxID=2567881 RepID=UPI0010CCFB61|nr:DUF58 domain-containing protein [Citricoccus sp. SGAir0253]QCU78632.1 DUF58 domain-containing protein [Citricoccus sp. SGAir0253]